MLTIGVDPGGRDTGMVVRDGDDLVTRCTVPRHRGQALDAYARHVLVVLRNDVLLGLDPVRRTDLLLAVEGVREPSPHVRLTNVGGLLDTAAVFGAVVAAVAFAPVVVVAPARHGSGPMAAYPEALRPTRGDGRGRDQLRHERSAWDVAGAGLAAWRTGGAVVWASYGEPEPEGGAR